MFDNDDDDLHDDDLNDDDGDEGEDGADDADDGEEEDDGSELSEESDEDEDTDDGSDLGEEEADEDEDDDLDADTVEELANQDDDGNPTVPKARLDEVLERARQLEEENARLKGTKPAGAAEEEPAFDMEAKLKRQIELQLEGDVDGAAAIALEIEKHRQKQAEANALAVLRQDRQQRSIEKAVSQVLKDYPELDSSKKGKFDKDALDEVIALRNFYITEKGMPIQSALRKAADRVMKRGSRGPTPKAGADKDADDQARIERLKKRAKAAARTPPDTGKLGEGNRQSSRINVEEIDPDDLSDEQLDELERKDPKAYAKLVGNA